MAFSYPGHNSGFNGDHRRNFRAANKEVGTGAGGGYLRHIFTRDLVSRGSGDDLDSDIEE